ncbi:MAG: MBL fold metallo-hydrolase [Proteobacteria bacterium]|nr:MBL fold metallo-hydrolase [Pseudomonadota bacterium]
MNVGEAGSSLVRYFNSFIASLIALSVILACETADSRGPQSQSTIFSQPWNSGRNAGEPAFHVQQIDTNTLAIRQSLRTTFEAPFMYLIFGEEKALLIDTGVEGVDLRAEIDKQIENWLARTGRGTLSLVVMHTHGHGDHVGGDAGFEGRPDTVVIGHAPEDVAAFFGLNNWPTQTTLFNLGNREVELLPTPGHHESHVMVFDKTTGVLFSGDVIYPGRLYFQCGKTLEFKSSIDRVVTFASTHDVTWLLGGHIEMKVRLGKSFNSQQASRTGEHLLELPVSIITEIKVGLSEMGGAPRVTQFDEFMLFPHPVDPTGMSPPDWCKDDIEQKN